METTETEVKTQEWGLGISSPNPLDQPLRYDIRFVWTTCYSPGPFLALFTLIQPKLVTQVLSRNARFVTRQ